ncbi:hypothetical protein [Lacibacter sp.]|uniref:hypothetical protein n=1 Tax=Lacibacter sp. TaxID=1915409 RepID=UPI002B4AF82C|nr:hypothetical protein [Lacibacter sp.]HLP36578.1 hypothetical protein [Lacibacter sp.]
MHEHIPTDSRYCPDCNSCGNEDCCNAADCLYQFNHPNCRRHLDHLLYVYKCNKKFISLIYQNQDNHKELIKEWEEICYDTSER